MKMIIQYLAPGALRGSSAAENSGELESNNIKEETASLVRFKAYYTVQALINDHCECEGHLLQALEHLAHDGIL